MKSLLLKGGRVIDPSQDHDDVVDLLIVDGKIEAMGKGLGEPDGAEIVDVTRKVVAPGLVDVHVHLREPGREDAETMWSIIARGFSQGCLPGYLETVGNVQTSV